MKYDELTRPTGLQQLRDKKKNNTKKQNPDFHSNNIADNFQVIETLVMNKDAYIRSVIRTNGKTPSIIIGRRREKTCLWRFANKKGADQPSHPRSLISAFVIRFLKSIICKLATGEL